MKTLRIWSNSKSVSFTKHGPAAIAVLQCLYGVSSHGGLSARELKAKLAADGHTNGLTSPGSILTKLEMVQAVRRLKHPGRQPVFLKGKKNSFKIDLG